MKPPRFFKHKDRPKLVQTSIRLEEDVLEWFRATGPGFQRRMNEVLRWYIDLVEEEERQQRHEEPPRDWRP